MAFLTLEDPNAKIKGSRDPLGAQPIWASFARHIVTNLTTQTTSVRGFTTLLLGRYFAARLIEQGAIHDEDALDVFLRTEQLCAYARHVVHDIDSDIRGIERVKRFRSDGRGKAQIQADKRGFILSDQKVYGLWGLYSVSARTSGLIPDGPIGLESDARDFIEVVYLPAFHGVLKPLLRLVANGGSIDTRGKDPILRSIANVLGEKYTTAELQFYGDYLRDGTRANRQRNGRQELFRRLLEENADLQAYVSREEITRLAERAQPHDTALAHYLTRIGHLEALLAPAASLFDYVLAKNGQRPDNVAENLEQVWGKTVPNLNSDAFRAIVPEIQQAATPEIGRAMAKCHDALRIGEYRRAVESILDWNSQVSATRGSAPWAGLAENGRINVRYRGIERMLPESNQLPTLWRNGYFIDSLKSMTRQLQNHA